MYVLPVLPYFLQLNNYSQFLHRFLIMSSNVPTPPRHVPHLTRTGVRLELRIYFHFHFRFFRCGTNDELKIFKQKYGKVDAPPFRAQLHNPTELYAIPTTIKPRRRVQASTSAPSVLLDRLHRKHVFMRYYTLLMIICY